MKIKWDCVRYCPQAEQFELCPAAVDSQEGYEGGSACDNTSNSNGSFC